MKRIAILSLGRTENYGAILQTYALQTYLKSQNFEVASIDYCNEANTDTRRLYFRIRSAVWGKLVKPLFADRVRIKRTNTFKNSYITYMFQTYNTQAQLSQKPPVCDYIIVGSDQVWNPNIVGFDSSWFLDFEKESVKKIAYAASFGLSELSDEYKAFCAPFIKSIKKISTREETGANIIQKLGISKPQVVVDPVFLLTKEEWSKIALTSFREKYVLCYYMPGFPEVERTIQRISKKYAQEHQLSIVNIGKKEYEKIYFWENNLYGTGPAEFVGLFQNADFVVTNSFHGTAFSVIFEKNFVSVVDENAKRGALSSRITDMLARFRMNSCVCNISGDKQACFPKIDYADKQKFIFEAINKSKKFLTDALEKENAVM
ncbi:MAG: hypothetical protein PWQ08_1161 [Clostridiales bacterium]|nr:hypothetical protein [Clostridiales bacterium]